MATTALGTVLHNLRRFVLRQENATLTDGDLLERFVSGGDEAAFEMLLHRHGPMVFGACRRLLQNEPDVEDAFQATFLVLVRKAGTIRPRGMVGNWLYGVAHSTALKARAMRTKRSSKERELAARTLPQASSSTWEDIEELLDQELKALPDKYRAPIVLCDLEGKSLKEAARDLGCPPATVGTRLARGRVMLARRLTRRGVTLSTGALAIALSQNMASAAVPTALTASLVNNVALLTAGKMVTGGMISAKAAALSESVLKTMLLAKLKVITVLLVPVLIGVAGLVSTEWAEPSESVTATEKVEQLQASVDQRQGDGGLVSEQRARLDFPKETPIHDGDPSRLTASGKEGSPPVPRELRTKALPRGLANKAASHPGRIAWLKSHGS
ncbi:hypothetical protein AYO44_05950 [Planctomycetaceae bacterium SCGC AG-212-F19]|nr:hypothetical protein AYO44_05950 [Planctomycetaceae bacterium SCGC AG-212-F19]